jgi:exopolyphosphatase/guanosine-5'-triphosphate,3'-diphosphate pyrophosphatase
VKQDLDRTPTQQDLDTISRQLGRPARDVVEIGARCVCGNPLVATTAPRLSNGIPFPTTFYLTHPVLTAAVSRLEASGTMAEMTTRLQQDGDLAARYRAAHEDYLAERDRVGTVAGTDGVPEIRGISAGGMPERVKCLHVLVGHSLAAGPGVNPLGDEALESIRDDWTADRCWCAGAWDQDAPVPSRDLSRHVRRLAGERNPVMTEPAAVTSDAPGRATPRGRVVGAIDCGTNSIRLLVARVEGPGGGAAGGAGDGTDGAGPVRLVDLHREMRVVRLGEGVDATGQLSEAALERTFAAAEDYARTLRELGAESVRFVATSASRDARNAGVFTAGIRERLGVEPEVISGDEEAALSFAGAASVLDPAALDTGVAGNTDAGTGDSAAAPAGAGGRERKVLVVDLGGGSTEFVLGTLTGPGGPQATDAVSVPMGCVRFTERHLHGDPPTADEIAAATADIEAVLDGVEAAVPLGEASAVVGVAGTITTVTAAALGLTEYDAEAIHGTRLDRATTTRISGQLLRATREERAALPYMHPGRVDVIGAGALIWSTLLRRVERATGGAVASAITSEHDILDGIALSQLA